MRQKYIERKIKLPAKSNKSRNISL